MTDVTRDSNQVGHGHGAVDCAVVVVTYNSADDLDSLLRSVPDAASGISVHVTVIDNDSRDHVGDVVALHRDVDLLRAPANLGYAAGINLAYRHLPASTYMLVLNPDVTLAPGSIEQLVASARRAQVAAVVPRIADHRGQLALSLRREPSVVRALGEALFGDHLPNRPPWAAEIVRDAADYDVLRTVDWATGAVLLVTRDAAEMVGDWDERYFLYSEETDYCRRLREAGYSILFDPTVTVEHRGGGSGSSSALVALLTVNKVRYFAKWHGLGGTAVFWLVTVFHSLVRSARPGERAALGALLVPYRRYRLPGQGRISSRRLAAGPP
jgi:GT2 family glycosyltransferase